MLRISVVLLLTLVTDVSVLNSVQDKTFESHLRVFLESVERNASGKMSFVQ